MRTCAHEWTGMFSFGCTPGVMRWHGWCMDCGVQEPLKVRGEGAEKKGMKIIQVLRVVDTREWVEEGDKWVAIAGSGVERSCERCGRGHEVHAYVLLEGGAQAVVGTGCSKADGVEVVRELKGAEGRAKTAARNEWKLKAAHDKLEAFDRAMAEVEAMELPALVEGLEDGVKKVRMGDAVRWHLTLEAMGSDDRYMLETEWKRNRMREKGFPRNRYTYLGELTDLERRMKV